MRVAIVAGPDPEQAFPAAGLGTALTDHGDEVLMLTGDRWLARLRHAGMAAQPLTAAPDPADEPTESAPGAPEDLGALTQAVTAQLTRFRPHFLVTDVRTPAGGLAAELRRVPWARLHPRPMSYSAESATTGGRGGLGALFGIGRARAKQQAERDLSSLRESLGLSSPGPGPLFHMVATLPDLEPPRPHWPSNATVVGPLIWDPATTDLPIPDGQAPLVMVSPSTSTTARGGLLAAALEGLQGMRVMGTVLEPYEQELPAWASVGPGRQQPVLDRASVVVTDGGHGMMVRALTAGVPLILVPAPRDMELARPVERLGVAVILRRADPRGLRRAVELVLEDRSYTSAARLMARTVTTADPVVLCHQALVGRSVS